MRAWMKRSYRWPCKRVRAESRGSISARPSRTARRTAGKQREGGRRTACSGSADSHCKLRQRRRSTNRSFCAARSHPPGFTRQAAPDWIGDRRWIGDIRRKEQMLVKVVTLEVTNSGKQAQYLGNRPRTFAQVRKVTFRKRIDSGPRSQRRFALSTVVAR